MLLAEAQAAHQDRPEAGYAQLATVDRHGHPACRTVRPRLLLPPDRLVIASDLRSAKVRHIEGCALVELCWYFPLTRQQFRLAGPITLADGHATGEAGGIRRRCWDGMSAAARQMAGWPPPGLPRAPAAGFAGPLPAHPPADFVALILGVARVDLLDLRPEPHARFQAAAASAWAWSAVNP